MFVQLRGYFSDQLEHYSGLFWVIMFMLFLVAVLIVMGGVNLYLAVAGAQVRPAFLYRDAVVVDETICPGEPLMVSYVVQGEGLTNVTDIRQYVQFEGVQVVDFETLDRSGVATGPFEVPITFTVPLPVLKVGNYSYGRVAAQYARVDEDTGEARIVVTGFDVGFEVVECGGDGEATEGTEGAKEE